MTTNARSKLPVPFVAGKAKYKYKIYIRPGVTMPDAKFERLARELRSCAKTCFDQLPPYQCLLGTRASLADKAIAVAWRRDGRIAGFCSCVLLDVDNVGTVLHLGLTCVRPDDRGSGLTHKLTSKVIIGYLARHRLVGKQWISNVACVLSSLGNVAMFFDEVFPSPLADTAVSTAHASIAKTIDERYRDEIYIRPDAQFDWTRFVFQGSVRDTVFQKDKDATAYHHRNRAINQYYTGIMSFDRGDEVLQVGSVSLLGTAPRYFLRKKQIRERSRRLLTQIDYATHANAVVQDG
ncbi:MAG: hypothetical protein H6684_07895 [Deltaproteobacteria bacterium]|nr:hypothetical protein [Deltaproteobacteria bacterium]MCB9488636.1 hypothetical protein [Deltaproteobacteria bacterium]